MKNEKPFPILVAFGFLLIATACRQPASLPLAIVGPFSAPVPIPTPAPVCGFTLLPNLPCGALTQKVTVIRDAAAWNALVGPTTCAGSKAVPIPDFSTQMIVVHSLGEGMDDFGEGYQVISACKYSDRLDVGIQITHNDSIMAPVALGPCACKNLAIAVPLSSLPIQVTECTTNIHFISVGNSTSSTTCTMMVY